MEKIHKGGIKVEKIIKIMFIKIKKNKIDLYKLKKIDDLISVENFFNNYIKRKFFKNNNLNKKFLKTNKICACGIKTKNKRIYKIGFFEYYRCLCGTIFTSPMVTDRGLNMIYAKKGPYNLYRKKFLNSKKPKKIRSLIVNKRKAEQIKGLFKKTNISVLDFGCGNGDFLNCCRKNGIKELYGIDANLMNVYQPNRIRYFNSLYNLKGKKFDCVTLWGVLEHLNNPIGFFKEILNFTKKNGVILIEVPHSESILMNSLNVKSKIYRFLEPARHLYFFSINFFNFLSKKFQLKIVDYETNGFDLQSTIGPLTKKNTKKILELQNILDNAFLSDHLRIALRKI